MKFSIDLFVLSLPSTCLSVARAVLAASRPTAVNLDWALARVLAQPDLEAAAMALHAEDIQLNTRLGENGADLLSGGVLTVCNTGALATGGHGTALGMIRSAIALGRQIQVFACETRPYNQARNKEYIYYRSQAAVSSLDPIF